MTHYKINTSNGALSILPYSSRPWQKINSFCDRHFDVPEVTDNISKNLSEGNDVLNRTHIQYQTVKLDDSFPQYIIDNQEKYSHLIK